LFDGEKAQLLAVSSWLVCMLGGWMPADESHVSKIARRGAPTRARHILVAGSLHDQVIDNAVRFVDMAEGAIAQTAYGRIIFFAGDIIVRLVEQFQGAVIAASVSHVRIDRRMVIQILAIINRSALDLSDGSIDLGDGVILLSIHPAGPCPALQMSASVAQVGERVQVCRMPPRFIGEGQRGAGSNKEQEYGAMSCSFHGLL